MLQNGSGTLSLAVNGGNVPLVLYGANTYGGGTTISSAGTLQLGSGVGNGSVAGNISNSGVLAFNNNAAQTYTGVISANGSLAALGSSVLVLTNTNTFGGGTTISSGTLQLGNGVTNGSVSGSIADSGVLAFNNAAAQTYAGAIGGNGGLNVLGPGLVVLTNTNGLSGATTISGGSLQLGNGIVNGSLAGNIADNSVLVFNNATAQTYAGLLSGGGTLNAGGPGLLVLSNSNIFSGPTTVSGGTLSLGNAGALQASSVTISSGGTLNLGVSTASVGGLSGSGNVYLNGGTLTVGNNSSTSFGGAITGAGGFTKTGPGTITLSSSGNTYTGPTIITGGVLKLGGGGSGGAVAIADAGARILSANGGNARSGTASFTIGAAADLLVVELGWDTGTNGNNYPTPMITFNNQPLTLAGSVSQTANEHMSSAIYVLAQGAAGYAVGAGTLGYNFGTNSNQNEALTVFTLSGVNLNKLPGAGVAGSVATEVNTADGNTLPNLTNIVPGSLATAVETGHYGNPPNATITTGVGTLVTGLTQAGGSNNYWEAGAAGGNDTFAGAVIKNITSTTLGITETNAGGNDNSTNMVGVVFQPQPAGCPPCPSPRSLSWPPAARSTWPASAKPWPRFPILRRDRAARSSAPVGRDPQPVAFERFDHL